MYLACLAINVPKCQHVLNYFNDSHQSKLMFLLHGIVFEIKGRAEAQLESVEGKLGSQEVCVNHFLASHFNLLLHTNDTKSVIHL